MFPKRIPGATATLGAPHNWKEEEDGKCIGLPVRVEHTENGRMFVSEWEPTPAELKALNAGKNVRLYIYMDVHPPVALGVAE